VAADPRLWAGCHRDRNSWNQHPLVPYAATTDPFCNEELAFPLEQGIDFTNITCKGQHMTVCVTNAENNVCSGYELTLRTEDMTKASISISNWLGMML
jgi:hypothetical protein